MRHVIIAGGAGYVGGILAAALREHDVRVTVLSRRARTEGRGIEHRLWDGRTLGEMVSWIHEHDFCRAVWWLLAQSALEGPVNLAAPEPVTNAAMMRMLRQSEGVPFGLPAHRALLELGAFFLRTETELIIKSRYVVSRRLADDGFDFQYKTLPRALTALKDARNGRDACPD